MRDIIMGFISGATIAAFILFVFLMTGCGSGGGSAGGNGSGDQEPVEIVNSLGFRCLDVDNDQTCDAALDAAGIFNSGPVKISGAPMPQDYLNIEIENDLNQIASIFLYMNVEIDGCVDEEMASTVFDIAQGEAVVFSETLLGYRCGIFGYNETVATIYNASHFNPLLYPSVFDYPRDQAIANAIVRWQNIGGG